MQNVLSLMALVAIGLSWLIPNHYAPWTSYYLESAMALGLFLLVAAMLSRRRPLEWPGVSWVLTGVAAIPWLQWQFGTLAYAGDAWMGSLYLLGLATAIAAGASWARLDAPKFAARLAVAVVAASLVSSVIGIWQVLDLPSLGIWAGDGGAGMRAEANLGQPNNLATLIGFGVLGTLMLFELRKFGRLAACMLLLVQLFGMALTQSRSALVFGPMIALAIALAARRGVVVRTRPLAVLGAAAFHLAVTWFWPFVQKAMLQDASLTLVQRGAGSIRFKVWPMLLDALTTSPWTGFGWLQVGAAELSAATRHAPAGEMWLHAHNVFFDLLIWCGVPLGLALSGLIVAWFVSRVVSVAHVESLVGMLMVAVLGVHSMLELPYHYAYFLIPAGLWIGVVEAQRSASPMRLRPWGTAIAGLAAAMTVAVWVSYVDLEEDFRRIRFEARRIGTPLRADSVKESFVLDNLTAFLRYSRTEPRSGMPADTVKAMDGAARRYPYVVSLIRVSEALALNGRLADATQRFLAIRHIHGDLTYQQARQDLRDKIADGHPGLRDLEASLPP